MDINYLYKRNVGIKETVMKQVLIFLFTICFFIPAIAQNEKLVIPWPETWKIGSQEKNRTMSMVELIPNNEKIDQWSYYRNYYHNDWQTECSNRSDDECYF